MTMNKVPHTLSSTRAPSDTLSVLVASVDLVDLLGQRYGTHGRPSGSSVLCSCPSADHADRHPSFTVYRNAAGLHRWKCQSQCARGGDALDLIEWLDNCSKGEAIKTLRQYTGDSWESSPRVKKVHRPIERPFLYRIADWIDQTEADRIYLDHYLAWRGWPIEIAQEFSLSVVTDPHGTRRIRHPYLAPTRRGEWVVTWYQDRGPKNEARKWLNPAGVSSYPYNLQSLERDNLRALVVCEGPADTITAQLALKDVSGIACIGIAGVGHWNKDWAPLLEGLLIVVAMDNDEAGEQLVMRVKESSPHGVIVAKPKGKDLSSMLLSHGLDEVRALLLKAINSPQNAQTLTKTREAVAMILAAFDGSEVL